MNKKKTSLIVPVLWFVVTGLWVIVTCMDLYNKSTSIGVTILHLICVALALVNAIVNLINYRKGKADSKEE